MAEITLEELKLKITELEHQIDQLKLLNLQNGTNDEDDNLGGIVQYHSEDNNIKPGKASGAMSTALGYSTEAEGTGAFTEGSRTKVTTPYGHAEGNGSIASGVAAHAQNDTCEAHGWASHAGGANSKANGAVSFAHGINISTNEQGQFAIGINNVENSDALFIVGNGNCVLDYDDNTGYQQIDTVGLASNAFVVYRDGSAEIQTVRENSNDLGVPNIEWVNQAISNALSKQIQIFKATEVPAEATADIIILYQ